MNGALGQLDWGLWVVRSSPLLEKKPFKFAAFIFPGQLGMVRSSSQPDVMVSTPWTSCTLKKVQMPNPIPRGLCPWNLCFYKAPGDSNAHQTGGSSVTHSGHSNLLLL